MNSIFLIQINYLILTSSLNLINLLFTSSNQSKTWKEPYFRRQSPPDLTNLHSKTRSDLRTSFQKHKLWQNMSPSVSAGSACALEGETLKRLKNLVKAKRSLVLLKPCLRPSGSLPNRRVARTRNHYVRTFASLTSLILSLKVTPTQTNWNTVKKPTMRKKTFL